MEVAKKNSDDEAQIHKPEFDLKSGIQCQYFKSTFARSLMLNQSAASCTRSLDIPVNFLLRDDGSSHVDNLCESDKISISDNPSSTTVSMDQNVHQTIPTTTNSPDLTECEVLQLRKKCQNLIEENRRLANAAHNSSSTFQCASLNPTGDDRFCHKVEATILQNKVDTLKWQMQQIESSRQMYRAIMESVAQFLERCHISLEAIQRKDPLVRSRILGGIPDSLPESSYPVATERPRSAANIRDLDLSLQKHSRSLFIDRSPDLTHPARSYNKFRDFTWRRSSKQSWNGAQAEDKVMEVDKLSQEAYRLLRNVTNLLNTQEPMLAQAKNAVEDSSSLIYMPEPLQASTPVDFSHHAFKSISRESCSSFRSSSDSNSTVSSKPEIDEELTTESISPPPCETSIIVKRNMAEDESGFSSMSSFQEIGLPLISSTPRSSSVSSESTTPDSDTSSTLIKIGLPLMPFHRRWDSAPSVPPKNGKLRSLSTMADDENMRVLWV